MYKGLNEGTWKGGEEVEELWQDAGSYVEG